MLAASRSKGVIEIKRKERELSFHLPALYL